MPETPQDIARKQVVRIQQAIELYTLQHRGRCPDTVAALTEAGLLAEAPLDPWERAYRFACITGRKPVVVSAGPDGHFGTEDDVDNASD